MENPNQQEQIQQEHNMPITNMFREEFVETELVPVWAPGLLNKDECPICYLPFTDPVKLPCDDKHTYCRECINFWFADETRNTCPECRAVMFDLPDEDDDDADDNDNVSSDGGDDHDDEEPTFFWFGASEESQGAYARAYRESRAFNWWVRSARAADGTRYVRSPGQGTVYVTGRGHIDRTELGGALVDMGNFVLKLRDEYDHRPYTRHQKEYWNNLLCWVHQECILRDEGLLIDVATIATTWRDRLRRLMPGMFTLFLGHDNVALNDPAWERFRRDLMFVLEHLAYVAFLEEQKRNQQTVQGSESEDESEGGDREGDEDVEMEGDVG